MFKRGFKIIKKAMRPFCIPLMVAVVILMPLAMVGLFSFSIIPWNPNADGMLQYYGTALSSLAMVYLGFQANKLGKQANEQNQRLIKLEEDSTRVIPHLSLLRIMSGYDGSSAQTAYESPLSNFRESAVEKYPTVSFLSFESPESRDEETEFIQILIHNFGSAPCVQLAGTMQIKSATRVTKKIDLPIAPGASTILTVVTPSRLFSDKIEVDFMFYSLSQTETSVATTILCPQEPNSTDYYLVYKLKS